MESVKNTTPLRDIVDNPVSGLLRFEMWLRLTILHTQH